MGASFNTSLTGTQHQRRHLLVHHDAANAAIENTTQIAHYAIVCRTGDSKNIQQNAIGREYICIEVNSCQLTI